jgi:hypothetical protein
MASERHRTGKRYEASSFYDGKMIWERTAVRWKFGRRASCRMESAPLTKLLPVALSFIWSRWLTIIGGWVWRLVESTSI